MEAKGCVILGDRNGFFDLAHLHIICYIICMNKGTVFKFKAGDELIEIAGKRRCRVIGGYSGEDGDFYKIFWIDNPTDKKQFQLWNREAIETFYQLNKKGH